MKDGKQTYLLQTGRVIENRLSNFSLFAGHSARPTVSSEHVITSKAL